MEQAGEMSRATAPTIEEVDASAMDALKGKLDAAYFALESLSREAPKSRDHLVGLRATLDALQHEVANANAKTGQFEAAYNFVVALLADTTAKLNQSRALIDGAESKRAAMEEQYNSVSGSFIWIMAMRVREFMRKISWPRKP